MAKGAVMKKRLRGCVAYPALAAVGICFGAPSANAVDGTWLAAPADGNWNNGANWTSFAVPDGTATFGQSTQTAITFTVSPTNVQTIQFTQGAPDYHFDT